MIAELTQALHWERRRPRPRRAAGAFYWITNAHSGGFARETPALPVKRLNGTRKL